MKAETIILRITKGFEMKLRVEAGVQACCIPLIKGYSLEREIEIGGLKAIKSAGADIAQMTFRYKGKIHTEKNIKTVEYLGETQIFTTKKIFRIFELER